MQPIPATIIDSDQNRLDYYLREWARWMRENSNHLDFSGRAQPFSGAPPHIDDLYDVLDIWRAETVNALILDLPPLRQAALRHMWLGEGWEYSQRRLQAELEAAYSMLLIGMDKKGLE